MVVPADASLWHLVLVAAVIAIVPGTIFNWIAGLKLPWAVAAAVPTTMGIVGFAGWALGQLGSTFRLGSVAMVFAVSYVLAALWRVSFLLARRWRGHPRALRPHWRAPGGLLDPRWVLPAAGSVVGTYLLLSSAIAAMEDLPRGLESIFQGWDVHWHASEVRYIVETGQADPTAMGLLRNLETHNPMYYPSGWHMMAALYVKVLHISPIAATNLTNIVLPALVLPMGVGLLAWRMIRGRGLAAQIAAGFAAAIVPVAPVLYWVGTYVGMWPYLVAMFMTGIIVALYISLPAVPVRMLAAMVGFMGMVQTHPAPATVVVMLLGLWFLCEGVWRPARRPTPDPERSKWSRLGLGVVFRLRDGGLLAAAGAIPTLILVPQLLSGSSETEDVKSFTAFEDMTRAETWSAVFLMRTRHSVEFFGTVDWTWLLWAAGVGGVVAVIWRQNLWAPLFVAVSAWITTNALRPYAAPWYELLNTVGSLHYATAHRLVMPVTMMVLAAAGVAVGAGIRLLSLGFIKQRYAQWASWVVSVIAAIALTWAVTPHVVKVVDKGAHIAVAAPYDDRMTGRADLGAFDWLAQQPRAYDGLIMGDPSDGHGWMYAYNGLPSIFRHYTWPVLAPWHQTHMLYDGIYLLGYGNRQNPDQVNLADEAAAHLGVNYIVLSPPNFWHWQLVVEEFVFWIWNAPGLTPVYKDGDVVIFAVNAALSDADFDVLRVTSRQSPDPLPEIPAQIHRPTIPNTDDAATDVFTAEKERRGKENAELARTIRQQGGI